MIIKKNLARMTSATIGTGSVSLSAAVSGYCTFAESGVSDGDVVSYGIQTYFNGALTDSEVGRGYYHADPAVLDRDTIITSTNNNNAITLTGVSYVFITALAEDLPSAMIKNVADFGAVPGVDCTTELQAAFDWLQEPLGAQTSRTYLQFDPGVYTVNGTLDLKDKYRVIIDGAGAMLSGDFVINASGSYIDIHNLYLHSTSSNPAFIYGRNSLGTGGNIRLHNVQVFSNNAVGAVLWGQADSSLIEDCEIYNAGAAPALILTSANETGLLDYASSTATFIRVLGGYIHGAGDTLVSMRGLLQNVVFDSVFFVPTLTSAMEIVNGGTVYELNLNNSRCEGVGDSVILKVATGGSCFGLVADNHIHALINADYVFDVDGTAWYWNLGIVQTSVSTTKLLNNSGEIKYSSFVTVLDETIVTTGTFDYCSVQHWNSTPISGTTGTHNYIIRAGVVEPTTQTVSANFSTATNGILLLSSVAITHLARFLPYQRITVIFDGSSSVGGGYFLNLPSDPYTGAAGEIREFISTAAFYWTMIQ